MAFGVFGGYVGGKLNNLEAAGFEKLSRSSITGQQVANFNRGQFVGSVMGSKSSIGVTLANRISSFSAKVAGKDGPAESDEDSDSQ